MTLGILLGGLGFMASAAGWCLLLREREERRLMQDTLDVQLSCLRGTLEKIEGSSEEIEFGLSRAEEFLRVGPERGGAAAQAVQQATKDASTTRRFCREFRRALQVTRQTLAEESARHHRGETAIRIRAKDRDRDASWGNLLKLVSDDDAQSQGQAQRLAA